MEAAIVYWQLSAASGFIGLAMAASGSRGVCARACI